MQAIIFSGENGTGVHDLIEHDELLLIELHPSGASFNKAS